MACQSHRTSERSTKTERVQVGNAPWRAALVVNEITLRRTGIAVRTYAIWKEDEMITVEINQNVMPEPLLESLPIL